MSCLECLSLDIVSLSVKRCCFLSVVDRLHYIRFFVCLFFSNCFSVFLYKLSLGTFDIVQRRELNLGYSAV